MKHNVIQKYNLPHHIKFCKKCTVSNQRPRITFDKEGICSACNFSKIKKNTDWIKREQELIQLLDKHRSTDGSF